MSSPTDHGIAPAAVTASRAVRRAVRQAGLAPWLSWLAVAVGLAFVVAFLLQAGLFALLVPREKRAPTVIANPDLISSYQATVVGRDKNGQPYELTAKHSWQDKDNNKLIHLERVAGKFHQSTGEPVTLSGGAGRYNSEAKGLDIEGDVVLSQPGRFTARMPSLHVSVADKSLATRAAVTVTFDGGTVAANGMQITNDGNDILFLNGVRSHFESAPATGGKSP